MTSTLLALDQGTTSSRAIVFDLAGREIARAQRPLPNHFPLPGWVEQDAREIWQTQLDCLREAVAQLAAVVAGGVALGMPIQPERPVWWARTSGDPLAPAIVWQDRRTVAACDALRAAGYGEMIRRKTGLELDAYFSATKLTWLLDQIPDARQRAERGELAFGTVDSWLVYKLTDGVRHVTDPSNASRTLLFNLQTGDWDDELLALFNIPRRLLPEIVSSSAPIGAIGHTAPHWLGFSLPITGIAGDQQAATFG